MTRQQSDFFRRFSPTSTIATIDDSFSPLFQSQSQPAFLRPYGDPAQNVHNSHLIPVRTLLFAAKKVSPNTMILVVPKTGVRYHLNADNLRDYYNIGLGNFMHSYIKENETPNTFRKMEPGHLKHCAIIETDGVMEISNLAGKVINMDGTLVIESQHFAPALAPIGKKFCGDVTFTIRILDNPVSLLSSGREISFEALNVVEKIGSEGLEQVRNDLERETESSDTEETQRISQKAVVLSKKDGLYQLWVFDSKTHTTLPLHGHLLPPGTFFEGEFKTNGELECKNIHLDTPLLQGGWELDGSVWFVDNISNYKTSYNQKFPTVQGEEIGEILDIDGKLSRDTKKAKVTWKEMETGDFVWIVVEAL